STALATGAVAGVSAMLVQADFKHRRSQLVDRYREETAAILQKAPDGVTIKDIEVLARGDFKQGIAANPAMRKELKNCWLERNVGVVLSGIVAAATFLIIGHFDPSNLHHLLEVDAGTSNVFTGIVNNLDKPGLLGSIGLKLGLNGLAAFATYHTLKTPLHMA